MKQISIYSALGLSETASDREVGHALRQALRDSYKKVRDNFGVLEDSLRFYNQASQILNDKNRRKLYDVEWSLSNASEEQRIEFVLRQAAEGKLAQPLDGMLVDVDETAAVRLVTALGEIPKPVSNLELVPEHADFGFQIPPPRLIPVEPPEVVTPPKNQEPASGEASEEVLAESAGEGLAEPAEPAEPAGASLPAAKGETTKGMPPPPTTQRYHPVLTENIGYLRSLIFQGLSAGLTALLIGALLYVTWEYALETFEIAHSWVWAVVLLLAVLLYSVGWKDGKRRREKDFELSGPPDEEAIKGWRRKSTIFLGSNFLAEDPSWVFQLRLTELERGRVGRTSYPRLWRRALARLFDYALWGWLLFFPLHELAKLDVVPHGLFHTISNPLVATVLITLTWIPVEALLMAAVGTTLGKWLFGVYIQFRVSTPYAPRGAGDCWRYALQRAFRVWWQGVAMGVAPLAPIAAARSRAAAERFDETDWDEKYDVLVTHTPMNTLPGFVGALGLTVLLLKYMMVWQEPLFEMGEKTGIFWVARHIEYGQGAETGTLPVVVSREPIAPQIERGERTGGEATGAEVTTAEVITAPRRTEAAAEPIDPETAEGLRRLEEFREAIVNVREESLLLLDKKDWVRAYESCQAWARLEVTNPAPRRCQGTALQAMGRHQEAINAFRSAKMYAPEDRSLDDAIARSQEEIFRLLNR